MNYNPSRGSDSAPLLETLQDYYTAIIEYYDELFPTDSAARQFLLDVIESRKESTGGKPAPMSRYLGIGCATGNLENALAQAGIDVTGIDRNPEMIETAKRRMKRSVSTNRFFEMSTLDMPRYLKDGSFNLIGCLDNLLPSIGDETLLRKFFHDARKLLAKNGAFVIEVLNLDKYESNKAVLLPPRGSVRVRLNESWLPLGGGKFELGLALELGSGKAIRLKKGLEYFAVGSEKLEAYAREAGFTECARYADFSKAAWTTESPRTIIVCTF
jgi:SAM-dependent methyltransferase